METPPFYIESFTDGQLTLPLHGATDTRSGCKVTVLIGPNGSGKSTAIAKLVDELALVKALIDRPDDPPPPARFGRQGKCVLKYRWGAKRYRIERHGTTLDAFADDQRANPRSIPFPSRALAVAHLPADKFRFSRNEGATTNGTPSKDDSPNEDGNFYWYLGLRQATNLATTGALESKVISSLLSGLRIEKYQAALGVWLEVLKLDASFQLELRNFRPEALKIRSVADLEKASRRPLAGGIRKYLDESDDARLAAVSESTVAGFFERLAQLHATFLQKEPSRRKGTASIPFEQLRDGGLGDALPWETGIDLIRKLRLVDEVRLIVSKSGEPTAFSDLSSGERQIIGTVTRLFEYAQNGCVIAIDEPEVSLHPSWQIRYVPTLLKALRHLDSGHVVIATHSHFIVSDVDSDMASLVVAEQQENQWRFETFNGEVYGRTPENILYRVFGVATAGNFFVEQDLANALQMISRSSQPDVRELREIRERLDKVSAEDNPAFNEILRHIDIRLGADTR